MLFLFGTRLLGSTDRVQVRDRNNKKRPFFHVATRFFHIQFIPLFPCSSYLVLDFDQPTTRGIKIPLSCKSICIAWLRSLLWLAVLIFGIATIGSIDDSSLDNGLTWRFALCFAVALGVAPIVTWHGYFNDASYDRAIELLSYMPNLGPREAILRSMVAGSFSAQNNSEVDDLEALVPYLPTATGELVLNEVHASSEIANDVEAQEISADGDANVTTAVAVAHPVKYSQTNKSSPEHIDQEHSSESRFTIE